MNYFYEDLSRLPILYQSMLPARKMQILSDVKCSTKDTYEYYLKSLKSSLRNKRKGKTPAFIDFILIEHDNRIKTSHKFFYVKILNGIIDLLIKVEPVYLLMGIP